jgi:hypothetical protein
MHECRPKKEEQGTEGRRSRHDTGGSTQRRALHPLAVVDLAAPRDSGGDQLLDQRPGPGPLGARNVWPAELHGAQYLTVERGFVLLEVERNPLIGHIRELRPDEKPDPHTADHEIREDPEDENRGVVEPEAIDSVRGDREHHDGREY